MYSMSFMLCGKSAQNLWFDVGLVGRQWGQGKFLLINILVLHRLFLALYRFSSTKKLVLLNLLAAKLSAVSTGPTISTTNKISIHYSYGRLG